MPPEIVLGAMAFVLIMGAVTIVRGFMLRNVPRISPLIEVRDGDTSDDVIRRAMEKLR